MTEKQKSISRAFNTKDNIHQLTSTFDATFLWLMRNKLLNVIPDCQTCKEVLVLQMAKQGANHDGRWYVCNSCELVKLLRYDSFAEEFKCTLMELTRLIFYYFVRGFTIDAVQKELTHYRQSSVSAVNQAK